MSTTIETSDRYTALPDEQTLADTVAALQRRGLSAEVVDDLDAARATVLARIADGSSLMPYPSVTLEATGIAQAIGDAARTQIYALDRETQMREIKEIMLLADFSLGSVHAITRDGVLVLASALGSQLAAHAWGAAQVVFVVGAQKLVPDLAAAHERIRQHCLQLEDARALQAYGAHSRIGKILEIHQEDPGRIHVVIIRDVVGF